MAAYGGPVPASAHNNTPQRTTTGPAKAKAPAKPKVDWTALAANPATRAKVPDAILKKVNPAAYAQRQSNQYNQAPITYGSQTTNRQLGQDTQAAIGLKYGAADQQLSSAYAQSAAQQEAIPHWFDYYRQQVQGLQAQDQTARQSATDEITNLGGTLAAAAGRSATSDQNAMASDAAIRGATVDPTAITRATQAAAVNTAGLADQAALQQTLGANQTSYWLGQQGAGEQGKVQALLGESNYRKNNIDSQAAALAQEKGDYGTTYKTGRITDERQAVLENQAFGLNSAKAASDAAAKSASASADADKYATDFSSKHGVSPAEYKAMTPTQRATSDRIFKSESTPSKPKSASEKKSAADLAYFKEHGYYPPTGPPKSTPVKATPKLSTSQQAKAVSTITTLAGFFQGRVWPDGPGKGKPATLAQLKKHYLLAGVDPRIVRVAESVYRNGGSAIGPYGAQQAQNLGVPVKGNWKVVGAKKKAGG